jgi:hypothetical protein
MEVFFLNKSVVIILVGKINSWGFSCMPIVYANFTNKKVPNKLISKYVLTHFHSS